MVYSLYNALHIMLWLNLEKAHAINSVDFANIQKFPAAEITHFRMEREKVKTKKLDHPHHLIIKTELLVLYSKSTFLLSLQASHIGAQETYPSNAFKISSRRHRKKQYNYCFPVTSESGIVNWLDTRV